MTQSATTTAGWTDLSAADGGSPYAFGGVRLSTFCWSGRDITIASSASTRRGFRPRSGSPAAAFPGVFARASDVPALSKHAEEQNRPSACVFGFDPDGRKPGKSLRSGELSPNTGCCHTLPGRPQRRVHRGGLRRSVGNGCNTFSCSSRTGSSDTSSCFCSLS